MYVIGKRYTQGMYAGSIGKNHYFLDAYTEENHWWPTATLLSVLESIDNCSMCNYKVVTKSGTDKLIRRNTNLNREKMK